MADNGMTLKVALMAAFLVVVMVALTFMPKPAAAPLKAADAEKLALNDAILSYPAAELKVLESTPQADGTWKVRVKISPDAHTACPKVLIREYELLPILFREEAVVKNCRAGMPIVYEEEALIKSLEAPAANSLAQIGAYGCATRASGINNLPTECASAKSLLLNISGQLPTDAWLAAWIPQGGFATVAVGMDGEGRLLLVEETPSESS